MSVSYPRIGQVINIDTYSSKNELRLILGFQELNVVTYPLFLSESVLYLSYGEEFIKQHIKIILEKGIDTRYILVHPIYYKDRSMSFKQVKSIKYCSNKQYVEEDTLSKWYTKNKLINTDMPDIMNISIEQKITEELNNTLAYTLEERHLNKLGLYKLSDKKYFVYLGYHKGMDNYYYIHVKKSYLKEDYEFYKDKKLKAVKQLGNTLLEAEQLGTVLKTDELCSYLRGKGLSI